MAPRLREERPARAAGRRRGRERPDGLRPPHRPSLLTRIAVVTGASSGIGAETARALARRGWHCILIARRRERLEELAAETGGEAEPCDVSDRDAVGRAAAAVLERHPAVHLLVNNAGIPGRAGFAALEPERIEELVRTNYLGSVWCLRAFLPGLERAAPSDVVNVVSVAGTVGFPPTGPYAATKAAQLSFSRSTAAELRLRGIRVHAVNPGFVHTEGFPNRDRFPHPLWRRLVVDPERVAEQIVSVVGSNRVETFVPWWYRPASVAQAVVPGLLARLLGSRRSGRLMR